VPWKKNGFGVPMPSCSSRVSLTSVTVCSLVMLYIANLAFILTLPKSRLYAMLAPSEYAHGSRS
jgi:hypothetical protein